MNPYTSYAGAVNLSRPTPGQFVVTAPTRGMPEMDEVTRDHSADHAAQMRDSAVALAASTEPNRRLLAYHSARSVIGLTMRTIERDRRHIGEPTVHGVTGLREIDLRMGAAETHFETTAQGRPHALEIRWDEERRGARIAYVAPPPSSRDPYVTLAPITKRPGLGSFSTSALLGAGDTVVPALYDVRLTLSHSGGSVVPEAAGVLNLRRILSGPTTLGAGLRALLAGFGSAPASDVPVSADTLRKLLDNIGPQTFHDLAQRPQLSWAFSSYQAFSSVPWTPINTGDDSSARETKASEARYGLGEFFMRARFSKPVELFLRLDRDRLMIGAQWLPGEESPVGTATTALPLTPWFMTTLVDPFYTAVTAGS